jgi:hypothetical protein
VCIEAPAVTTSVGGRSDERNARRDAAARHVTIRRDVEAEDEDRLARQREIDFPDS